MLLGTAKIKGLLQARFNPTRYQLGTFSFQRASDMGQIETASAQLIIDLAGILAQLAHIGLGEIQFARIETQ